MIWDIAIVGVILILTYISFFYFSKKDSEKCECKEGEK